MLPVGLKDEMGADTVKIFCPKCQCVYHPPPIRSRSGHHGPSSGGSGAVDGAAFGTTFPHLFLMTFNNLVPDGLISESSYVPRVFGFRVHQSARQRNGGPGSHSFYLSNHRKSNAESLKPSVSATLSNGNTSAKLATNSGQNSISSPQVQNGTEDKTTTISASAAAYQQDGSISKCKGSSTPRYNKKVGDYSGKGGKDEDVPHERVSSGTKRKPKANDMGKNADNFEHTSTKSKRQRKPST